MTESRYIRLLATLLILGSLVGMAFVRGEGSAWFPVSVVLGIIVLVAYRPRNDHRGRR